MLTGAALFENATSENAVMLLRLAIKRFGQPASILSDNGPCFVGQNGRKKGTWERGSLQSLRRKLERRLSDKSQTVSPPQTNGRLERFHRSLENEIWNYGSPDSYIDYYNERRLHFA